MVNETLGNDVPWVLQDHPVATGVQMSTSVILRIIQNCPTCVMLKHEDCPGLAKLSALRAASERGDARRVSILAGNGGGLFLPEELARGADGAMTGFAYPEMMVGVCRRSRRRRHRAGARHLRRLPAAGPLRAASRHRAGGAQAHPGRARRDRLARHPQARPQAFCGRHRRHRASHRAANAAAGGTPPGRSLGVRSPWGTARSAKGASLNQFAEVRVTSPIDMQLDARAIDILSQVTTATLTTILLKKGLRNVWMRGTRPLRPGPAAPCRAGLHAALRAGARRPGHARILVVADLHARRDRGDAGGLHCRGRRDGRDRRRHLRRHPVRAHGKRGVAALVTDGVVRDVAGVLATGLPVWCQGRRRRLPWPA